MCWFNHGDGNTSLFTIIEQLNIEKEENMKYDQFQFGSCTLKISNKVLNWVSFWNFDLLVNDSVKKPALTKFGMTIFISVVIFGTNAMFFVLHNEDDDSAI